MGNMEDSTPAVEIVSECKTSENAQQIYMMDADDTPSWIGDDLEEYFPREIRY